MSEQTRGHALAEAWEAWLESEEGLACANPRSLLSVQRQHYYLKNRLWRAFMAGAEAACPPDTSQEDRES